MTDVARMERRHLAWVAIAGIIVLGVFHQPASDQRGATGWRGDVPWDHALERARQVDLNTADLAALERLPGIGPSLARRIMAHREAHGRFQTPEAMMDVSGIGPKTYDALKAYVVTE